MKLLALLATYLAVTAGLFGGLVGGVLWVVKPDPTATAAPRVAPISPRIADSIERKKMDAPAPTPVGQTTGTTVAPEPIQPVMQGAPAALTHAPQIHIRELNERIAK